MPTCTTEQTRLEKVQDQLSACCGLPFGTPQEAHRAIFTLLIELEKRLSQLSTNASSVPTLTQVLTASGYGDLEDGTYVIDVAEGVITLVAESNDETPP